MINHTNLITMVPNLKSTTNIAYWLHGISSCNIKLWMKPGDQGVREHPLAIRHMSNGIH
jgi:hypothetical protein